LKSGSLKFLVTSGSGIGLYRDCCMLLLFVVSKHMLLAKCSPPDVKEMRFVGEKRDVKWVTFKKALINKERYYT
jgi:hypothetical protein